MATVKKVCGLFHVSMDVWDSNGFPISAINSKTTGVRHIVTVENISPLSKDVEVQLSLPNGRQYIEFATSSGNADKWTAQATNVAPPSLITRECQLVRASGGANPNEPIQCDAISQRRGQNPFRKLNSNQLPFSIIVSAH